MNIEIGTPTGWICPKCGKVMSPTMPYCLFCCADKYEYTSTGTDRAYRLDWVHNDSKTEANI